MINNDLKIIEQALNRLVSSGQIADLATAGTVSDAWKNIKNEVNTFAVLKDNSTNLNTYNNANTQRPDLQAGN